MIGQMVERVASSSRVWLAALSLAGALLLAQPALGHGLRNYPPGRGSSTSGGASQSGQTEQGVVQSISSRTLVLRELNGTVVTISIGAQTEIFVDGRPARADQVKPGFVVVASSSGSELRFVRSS
jgi:hypothetical protein